MPHEGSPATGWASGYADEQGPVPAAAASSLQSLLQTNPGILKTIQPNDAPGMLMRQHSALQAFLAALCQCCIDHVQLCRLQCWCCFA